jgi:hypothetical protein
VYVCSVLCAAYIYITNFFVYRHYPFAKEEGVKGAVSIGSHNVTYATLRKS